MNANFFHLHAALTVLVLLESTHAFSIKSVEAPNVADVHTDTERPLLQHFGKQLQNRIVNSRAGVHRFGMEGAYTSDETFPCLDMQCSGGLDNDDDDSFSSRKEIRDAFNESSGANSNSNNDRLHGKSSGSGCCIIRLSGDDASSIRGLVDYANDFFEKVDNDDTRKGSSVKDVGVFKIDQFLYAGFDQNVNNEGLMQFVDTRILPRSDDSRTRNSVNNEDILIPMEVGELVGKESLRSAHKGIATLMDVGYQITSAVLEMHSKSADKLIDDGTTLNKESESTAMGKDVSNSYHRLIRYINSGPSTDEDTAAFRSHIDSSFLTLIPMPKVPGLEIWCPCLRNGANGDGEWVRPIKPDSIHDEEDTDTDDSVYIIAMAGEFLQLLSNGKTPTCIHRVLPAKPGRISAPLFLRPRRGEDALLDVDLDLNVRESDKDGLYFEPGLLDECHDMHLWSAHGIM